MILVRVEVGKNTKIVVESRKGKVMKKLKKIIPIIVIICIIVIVAFWVNLSKNWTIRYASMLDDFFGKGNWKCIDEETKNSLLVDKHIHFHDTPELDYDTPAKYKNWYILFTNKNGEEEIYSITNHTYIINHDKYNVLNSKRYSAKQALTLELMDISTSLISDDIFDKYISNILPSNISDCISVEISYTDGNPNPNFYTKLSDQEWFNIYDANIEKYLSTDLYDFYIYIKAYDYKIEKLSDDEKQKLFNSMSTIENKLLEDFSSNASFKIYFSKDYNVEYLNGVKR